jgi:hypothetical protein
MIEAKNKQTADDDKNQVLVHGVCRKVEQEKERAEHNQLRDPARSCIPCYPPHYDDE